MKSQVQCWLFATLSALGTTSAVAQSCTDLMRSHAVPEPIVEVHGVPLMGGILDCTFSQTAMFERNYNAIAAATPISESAEIYGTWLGDNVLQYVQGLVVPGQEVLRITPGVDAGSIRIRQYWIKASLPVGYSFPWDAEDGYQGLVTETVLLPDQRKGKFKADIYGRGSHYSEHSFEFDRSYDLWVKSHLNYFEDSVDFALDGDALVLRFSRREPILREFTPDLATFSRVANGAPDFAILLIKALELSQARNFDCFTNQISAGKGALIDAMAPSSAQEIRRILGQMASVQIKLDSLIAENRSGAASSDAHREAMMIVMEESIELRSTPVFENVISHLADNKDLGCPALP